MPNPCTLKSDDLNPVTSPLLETLASAPIKEANHFPSFSTNSFTLPFSKLVSAAGTPLLGTSTNQPSIPVKL